VDRSPGERRVTTIDTGKVALGEVRIIEHSTPGERTHDRARHQSDARCLQVREIRGGEVTLANE
jgi:hypothetical protein